MLNGVRRDYGHKMRETYPSVGCCVARNGRYMELCLVADGVVALDGAAATTTHALYDYHRDVFFYVELRLTGHRERTHTGGVFGKKALMRFTGADDSGEWLDVVVINASALAETVAA